MPFNSTDSWNPANDPKQTPRGGGGAGGGLDANFSSAGAAPTGISWGDAVNYKPSF